MSPHYCTGIPCVTFPLHLRVTEPGLIDVPEKINYKYFLNFYLTCNKFGKVRANSLNITMTSNTIVNLGTQLWQRKVRQH